MRGFAAVFYREIAERRLLAVVGLLSLLPLALPWLGRSWFADPATARGAVALGVALIGSSVLALLLGASAIAPELAAGRLGFYFGRPIGAGAIWAGKLGAALALSLAAGVVAAGPAWLLDSGSVLSAWGLADGRLLPALLRVARWAFGLLMAVLAAHAISVMARSRSTWLLLDIAGAAAFTRLTYLAIDQLSLHSAFALFGRLMTGLLFALAVALLAASALQVALGRADLRRSHAVLSLALWGLLLASALGAVGYGRWVLAVSPQDIAEIRGVAAAPAGDWIAVRGTAAGRGKYEPALLVDAASGRYLRIGAAGFTMVNRPRFSADGRRAAWAAAASPLEPAELVYADLAAPRPVPVATGIPLAGPASAFALSPDGRRVALVSRGRLLVHELESGRLAATATLPVGLRPELVAFAAPGRARFFGQRFDPVTSRQITEILELDLAIGRLARTGEFLEDAWSSASLGPGGERMILISGRYEGRRRTLRLLDARTGRQLADLSAAGASGRLGWPRFLADGRIVFPARGEEGLEVRLLDRDGAPLATFPFPGARVLRLGGETDRGQLVVATSSDPVTRRDWRAPWESRLLDLRTGATRPLARGLVPAPWIPLSAVAAGDAHLFADREGRLVRLDPETGRRRLVLEGKELPAAG